MTNDDGDWKPFEMTEQEFHALPDFAKLLAIVHTQNAELDGLSIAQIFEYLSRTVHPAVIEHFAEHRAPELALTVGVPLPVVMGISSLLEMAWKDGFILGAKFQAQQDRELASFTAPDTVPDGL